MVWSYLKILLCTCVFLFCVLPQPVGAEQIRVIVSPVNVATSNSSYSIYPNISEFMANDILNELNKNLRFNAIDLNSSEKLLMSQGLYEDYRDFLRNYKDSKVIDYRLCGLLTKKLDIDKILLVSSSFSLQDMILKRPLLYKIGITEVEPVQSFYTLNVDTALIDTQSCIVDFEETYRKKIKTKNFEVPVNSLNDNILSSEKIKQFSEKISEDVTVKVFTATNRSGYARVNSNIVSTTNVNKETRDGLTTRDGHSYSTNNNYLKNKRIESFKNWVKKRVEL